MQIIHIVDGAIFKEGTTLLRKVSLVFFFISSAFPWSVVPRSVIFLAEESRKGPQY